MKDDFIQQKRLLDFILRYIIQLPHYNTMQIKQIYEVFFVELSHFSYLPLIPPIQIKFIISISDGIENDVRPRHVTKLEIQFEIYLKACFAAKNLIFPCSGNKEFEKNEVALFCVFDRIFI